jgi:hypothetical protein
MRKWLKDLRGERVSFTGGTRRPRYELEREVRRKGGIINTVAQATVLVRGDSSRWKFGSHGLKEQQAARLIRKGKSISLVHESEFGKLLEKGKPARVADRIAGEPVEWLTEATKRQFERAANMKGPLDREYSALGRVEQGYLRQNLFGESEFWKCSLCGRRLPVGLLVAAHLKPRSECSRRERLDNRNIVFGVCLLGCDALYERGLIAVGNEGCVLVSAAQSCPALNAELCRLRRRICRAWRKETAGYFEWHLTRRFQRS